MAVITLNPLRSRGTISKNIYGHFSEHLGRCIYQGLYVGEGSSVPNVRGIRTAAVEALKKIGVPVPAAASRMSITGRTASARRRAAAAW